MRRLKWIIALPVVALLLVTAGTWTYIHVLSSDAPARLTLGGAVTDNVPATTATTAGGGAVSAAPASFDGTWTATTGSQAGYRVKELLFGQSAEAVGRTGNVDGALTLSGTKVETAAVSIDLGSVTSDRSQRDGQFRNRIMDVTRYPTATFTLTQPIDLGTLPADGATITVPATGDLTLHGTKRAITTTLSARRTGGRIEVNGTIPVTFADYNIPNPSFGPAQTEDHGDIEFLIAFAKSNT
ncbi:MAG TPA: YceI family protein [Acidimicrobiia bacterium]|nr:YceI family protein [Acidimicrobiia bacterium]